MGPVFAKYAKPKKVKIQVYPVSLMPLSLEFEESLPRDEREAIQLPHTLIQLSESSASF